MTGVRLAVCRCIARVTSSEHIFGDGVQLRGSRLVFFTDIAAEAWAGCWCSSWALAGGGGRAGKGGGRDSGSQCQPM